MSKNNVYYVRNKGDDVKTILHGRTASFERALKRNKDVKSLYIVKSYGQRLLTFRNRRNLHMMLLMPYDPDYYRRIGYSVYNEED